MDDLIEALTILRRYLENTDHTASVHADGTGGTAA